MINDIPSYEALCQYSSFFKAVYTFGFWNCSIVLIYSIKLTCEKFVSKGGHVFWDIAQNSRANLSTQEE